MKPLQQLTEYACPVTSLAIDQVVPTLLHVGVRDGFLTTYDLRAGTRRVKHRQLGAAPTALQQLGSGRRELLCACMDGSLHILDFDLP